MTLRKIGRYQIKSELGRGGMATVYLAHDPQFERDVALKVLPREFLHDPKFRARFTREAKTIASLEHAAIVPVYDFGEEKGQPFLVMRYMTGGSLADKLEDRSLSLNEISKIIGRLSPALDKAHARGIIHRDLKPGNILFDEEGNAYLSDFGIVKIAEATASLTGAGIVGTPAYMSPEQVIGGRKLDGCSDIYALGVIIFQMLTGELPYDADTPMSLLFKHVNEPIPSVLDMKPNLPPACNEIIAQAMAKEPDQRYQTAEELAAALEAIPEEVIADVIQKEKIRREEVSEIQRQEKVFGDKPIAIEDLPLTSDEQFGPGIVPIIEEPKIPSIEAERKRLPKWAILSGIVVVIALAGGIGGTLIKRSQDAKVTQTVVAMMAAETRSVVETETARPTETPTTITTLTATTTMTPTTTATPTPITTMISEVDGIVMMYVPEGSFLMGSPPDDSGANDDEFPQHEVYLDGFWIDRTEVTNAQYRQCVEDGVCQTPTCTWGSSTYGDETKLDHPAACVDWYGAVTYCKWAGRRLPTEAEWEKAARGEDGRVYPWGDESPNCALANYYQCGGRPCEVGTYPSGASPYGALDMACNVWEWVSDWYDGDYYENSPTENPSGPYSGDWRVLRGGSWNSPDCVRATYRLKLDPYASQNVYGFRCARGTSP